MSWAMYLVWAHIKMYICTCLCLIWSKDCHILTWYQSLLHNPNLLLPPQRFPPWVMTQNLPKLIPKLTFLLHIILVPVINLVMLSLMFYLRMIIIFLGLVPSPCLWKHVGNSGLLIAQLPNLKFFSFTWWGHREHHDRLLDHAYPWPKGGFFASVSWHR